MFPENVQIATSLNVNEVLIALCKQYLCKSCPTITLQSGVYIYIWCIFFSTHLTVPGQQDLGYYSLFFQDILWRHEWVKNGKGPAGSNTSWPRGAEDLNLFCYSGSSFTKQSICNKWFISNLPFILLAFWPMIHLEILYKSNLNKSVCSLKQEIT